MNDVSSSCPHAATHRKTRFFFRRFTALALAVAGTVRIASGQATGPTFTFDDTNSLAPWYLVFGTPSPGVRWDSTLDSTNGSNSGSLRVTEQFTGATNEFFVVSGLFLDRSNQPVKTDLTRYLYMTLDLRVDPGTAPDTGGTFGFVQLGIVSSNWGFNLIESLPIPVSATNWTHLRPWLPPTADLSAVIGIYLQVGSWLGNFTNTLTMNLDNFGVGGGYCCAPSFLWMERAEQGEGYWLKWAPPAPNARVQLCTNLANGQWRDTGLETNAVPVSGGSGVLLAPPADSQVFWRLWLGTN